MIEKALIIGGDKRQTYLKKHLSGHFSDVCYIRESEDSELLNEIDRFSHIVFPVPVSKDGDYIFSNTSLKLKIADAADLIKPYHKVYGAGFDRETINKFEKNKIKYYDFMKDMTFKRANAVLTAQGTLRLLLDNTENCVSGKKALIIGFGDVAQTLADLLFKAGIRVCISARKPMVLHLAELLGYKTTALKSVGVSAEKYDYIFGTVPARILREKDISSMKDSAVYFELASPPFTAEKEFFVKHKKRYIFGGGLPGRYLPEASAKLISDFILCHSERE